MSWTKVWESQITDNSFNLKTTVWSFNSLIAWNSSSTLSCCSGLDIFSLKWFLLRLKTILWEWREGPKAADSGDKNLCPSFGHSLFEVLFLLTNIIRETSLQVSLQKKWERSWKGSKKVQRQTVDEVASVKAKPGSVLVGWDLWWPVMLLYTN